MGFIRGDIMAQKILTQADGNWVLKELLDSYLIESRFEEVKKFNHDPNNFEFEKYIEESVQRFRAT